MAQAASGARPSGKRAPALWRRPAAPVPTLARRNPGASCQRRRACDEAGAHLEDDLLVLFARLRLDLLQLHERLELHLRPSGQAAVRGGGQRRWSRWCTQQGPASEERAGAGERAPRPPRPAPRHCRPPRPGRRPPPAPPATSTRVRVARERALRRPSGNRGSDGEPRRSGWHGCELSRRPDRLPLSVSPCVPVSRPLSSSCARRSSAATAASRQRPASQREARGLGAYLLLRLGLLRLRNWLLSRHTCRGRLRAV